MRTEQLPRMKKLALVRHGEYDRETGHINSWGREQLNAVGMSLKSVMLPGETNLILSSSCPRAVDSAEIIADILYASFQRFEILWSDRSERPEDLG